ncbi:hypothetical protein [Burkholderia cenocepacia]|uniref:hypothetical protein n=1 Tax=Burkholderia cenocepacia TaxID=95486 RepID=UPI0015C5368A
MASVAPAGTVSVSASTKSSLRSHGAAPWLICWTLHACPCRPASGGNRLGASNATRSNCARESLYGGFAAFWYGTSAQRSPHCSPSGKQVNHAHGERTKHSR